jgi:DNA-binding MltR family transcriptional regulator
MEAEHILNTKVKSNSFFYTAKEFITFYLHNLLTNIFRKNLI